MINPSHPGVALGPIGPIGVVAAPGPSGPVGLGIGVPLLSSSMVPQMGPVMSHHHHQKKLVSPDSSEDNKDKYGSQMFPQRTSPPGMSTTVSTTGIGSSHVTWANPLLQSVANMGYPIMGMSVIGPPNPQPLSDANILYGMMGTNANGNEMNIANQGLNSVSPSLNIPNPAGASSSVMPNNSSGSVSSAGSVPLPPNETSQPSKEIIHCKSCTLFPPNPSAPSPTTREKPPGCRTVFVGGLPELVTDEIIREIFDRCGEITTIRMSKKNFCHIRFELEHSIEAAIFLSGYRIRIGSNSDPPNIGRLHVDYAQARDDLYEFECRQRQLLREQRHRERIEQERLLPPSPPPTVHFSEHEAGLVAERIKSDDTFMKGIYVLCGWLDRGDCAKKNSNAFYSMIQSTNSHVRRLLNEKSQYEDELQKAKELMKQRVTGLLMQFSQIEKVFVSACQKKSWDHFTKAQRKNIEMWRKQASEIKSVLLEEALAERTEEEMDLSDSSECENSSEVEFGSPPKVKKPKLDENGKKALNHLQEENDALRCQLEAANSEVDLVKADSKAESESKDLQVRILQEKLSELQRKSSPVTDDENGATTEKTCTSTISSTLSEKVLKDIGENNCDSSCNGVNTGEIHGRINSQTISGANCDSRSTSESLVITQAEAKLIAVVSTFLHVHPFGASLDYIWSYTQKVQPNVSISSLESLLVKFPTLFRQEVSGIGASLERKWNFIGFS